MCWDYDKDTNLRNIRVWDVIDEFYASMYLSSFLVS